MDTVVQHRDSAGTPAQVHQARRSPDGASTRAAAIRRTAPFLLAPVAMLGFTLLDRSVLGRDDASLYLHEVAAQGDRFLAGTLLYMVAMVLTLPIGLSLTRLLKGRWSGAVGGPLIMLGAMGGFGHASVKLFLWAYLDLVGPDAELVRAYDHFQHSLAFPAITFPLLVGAGIGTVIIIVGLFRSRVVPRWVPLAMVAGTVAGSGELGVNGNTIGALIGLITSTALASAVWKQSVGPRS